MRPTIRKIAEQNGVSPATVSLVLNDRPGVKKETRERIRNVLEEAGFEIRKQENRCSISYICYQITRWFSERPDGFHSYIQSGIAEGCRKHDALLNVTYATEETIQERIQEAEKSGALGIVLLGTEFAQDSPASNYESEIPLVIIDHPFYTSSVNCIFPDDIAGMHEVLECLKKLGHKEIGFVSLKGAFGELHNREQIWRHMMNEHHLKVSEEFVFHLSSCVADAQTELEHKFSTIGKMPTALIAVNDILGSSVIGVLTKKGLRVPEDISVVGFDNSGLCELTVPKLSSVDTQVLKMGELAVRRLFEMAELKDESPVKIMTAAHLIMRDSVGRVSQGTSESSFL